MNNLKHSFVFNEKDCILISNTKLYLGATVLNVGDGIVVSRIGGKDRVFVVKEVKVDLSARELTATSHECSPWVDKIKPEELIYAELMIAKFRVATKEEVAAANSRKTISDLR